MKCIVLSAILFILLVIIFRKTVKIHRIQSYLEAFSMENESIHNRKIKNQLDLFTYSRFSTDCCPSTYTSSIGCLCNNHKEHETITSRGGNRVQL